MEETNKIEKIFNDAKDYAETRFDIIVLNAQDKASGLISSFAVTIILGVLGFISIMFLSIDGAWFLVTFSAA